jgi:PAS domain S-box-containing protein
MAFVFQPPKEHLVQFYDGDDFLIQRVVEFFQSGLTNGESAVAVATRSHLQALESALGSRYLSEMADSGLFIGLDAEQTLARFMRDGQPDEKLFFSVLSEVMVRASNNGSRRVRAFGEMVAILCEKSMGSAAMALESLWNKAAQSHDFSLLCAYPMNAFPNEEHGRDFARICASHSHVLPFEASNDAEEDESTLHHRIAVLEQKARALKQEIAWRKDMEQALSDQEKMLRERTDELTNRNRQLLVQIEKSRRAEKALIKTQHILTSAERISHLGSWEYHEETQKLECSDEFYRICGLPPQCVPMTLERVMSLVHPDDKALAQHAVERTRHQGEPYRINKRIVRINGEIRYVVSRGEPVFEGRRLKKVIGSFLDVTEQRLAQAALEQSEARFRSLVNLSSDWYWEQDSQMRFRAVLHHNNTFPEAITNALTGQTLWEVEGASWKEADRILVTSAFANRLPFHDFEYAFQGENDQFVFLQISGEPMYDAAGCFAGYRGIGKDVTHRVRREKQLFLFRSAMDATDDAVFLFDRRGRSFFDINRTACKMLGYSRSELLRLTPEDLGSRSAAELDWLYEDSELPQRGTVVETWVQRKDGSRLQVELERRRLLWNSSWIIVAVLRDITRRKQAEQELKESQAMLRGLTAHQQKLKEDERKRIAQEVHDEMGSLLACIKAYIAVALDNAARVGAPHDKLLVDAGVLAGKAMESVRRIISDLRPSILDDLGIWAALEWYAKQVSIRTEMHCSCTISTGVLDLRINSEYSTMLFRVVQEALTNVVRHAAASRAEIRASCVDGTLVLEVRDNGKGIAPDRLINGESWGVLGMHERTAYFGAELKIQGVPGEGTSVAISLPLSKCA